MQVQHFFKRAAAYGAGLALTASGVSLAAPSHAAPVSAQETANSATNAVNWLMAELSANGNRFQQSFNGQKFDDIGLTIDGLLAVASAGRNADARGKAAADYVVTQVDEYVTAGTPNALAAGAVGKSLVFAQSRNINSAAIDGHNLEPELRSLLAPSGRFSDKGFTEPDDFNDPNSPTHPADYSNGFSQAFAMIALSRTSAQVPANAVTWLLAQQCPNGGFRLFYDDGVACTNDANADVDATAFAIQALSVSPLTTPQEAKVDDAVDYLLGKKGADDLIGNANSSGLASSALRTVGLVPDANKVAAAVEKLQLTSGAIALTPADAQEKKASGIPADKAPTYWRSTAQAVFALGIPSYVDRGFASPVQPRPHIESSTAAAKQGDPVTVTGGGFEAGETVSVTILSDPVNVGSVVADRAGEVDAAFTIPTSVSPGTHTIRLAGADSGVVVTAPLTVSAAQVGTSTTAPGAVTTTTARPNATIARTGNSTDNEALFGGALVVAGVALMLATRRRKIVYPFKR